MDTVQRYLRVLAGDDGPGLRFGDRIWTWREYLAEAGRTSGWLRVDGENLAAGVIERILLRHPAVNRVAVHGVPDPHAGDQLVAALVLGDGAEFDAAGFERFLDAQGDLPAVGRPRYVRVATDLPCTATNKVLKRELLRQGLDVDDPVWERAERGTTYHPREAKR